MPPAWTCPACKLDLATPFCPRCGERALQPRHLELRGLADALFHELTSIDGRLVRSVWSLLRRPGSLTLAYVAGDRKRYIAPFQLFLLSNVLFFFIQSWTGINVFSTPLASQLHQQDWSELAQRLVARHLEATHAQLEDFAPLFDRSVALYAKSLIILMVAPFALVLALLYWRSRRPFLTHAVFSLHLCTFLLLLFCVTLLVAALAQKLAGAGLDSATVDTVLSTFNLVVCGTYVYFATGAVFHARGAARVLEVVGLAVTAGAVVLGYRFVIFLITLHGC
ncbi:MAG: DUF3667 domain-containing protein [Planctomycetes bacterium]|nr:DUF3667 domain-containing protein [Planctomycetota bacterium]